jgi:hypothetical protein
MEPAGLAIGILGLAGLFSTVLDALDAIGDYRSFTADSHVLKVQLNSHRTLLQRWGQIVGLGEDKLAVDRGSLGQSLDAKAAHASAQLLQIARDILLSDDVSSRKARTPGLQADMALRWRKLAWALHGKSERKDQVKLLGEIVDQLYKLLPSDQVASNSASHKNDLKGLQGTL